MEVSAEFTTEPYVGVTDEVFAALLAAMRAAFAHGATRMTVQVARADRDG